MLIPKRQFEILCQEYTLSPTQIEIARLLLKGKTLNREFCQALGKEERNVQKQIQRMANKMFCRNRTDILWRFLADARKMTP
ncbi:MAG: helix-turn-helix transcriptional regulator [Planctomycetota bacterium]|jgi:DNA-binding NarL/FixJ family response regulator